MRASALRRREDRRAIGRRFVDENGVFRHQHAERLPDGFGCQVSAWRRGLGARLTGRRRVGRARLFGKRPQCRRQILLDRSHHEEIATRRALHGWLVLVSECCDRKQRADKNQLLEGLQKLEADFEFVGDRVHGRTPFAARKVIRRKYFR